MKVGSLISAPEGHGSLQATGQYYLVHYSADPPRVLLAEFSSHKNKNQSAQSPKVTLLLLSRSEFDESVSKRIIIEKEAPNGMPPWLAYHGNYSDEFLENRWPGACRIARKWREQLAEAVDQSESILRARNLSREINQYARKSGTNYTRFRFYFITYLTFGRDWKVLLPQTHLQGRYDRDTAEGSMKVGRPSVYGKYSGCRINPSHKESILACYHKSKGLGTTRKAIYIQIVRVVYGCKVHGQHIKNIYQPDGKPFPTKKQINYFLDKIIGKLAISEARFGGKRVKRKNLGDRGSTIEHIVNLGTKFECDGYFTEDEAIGPDNSLLGKLLVVRIICALSRMILGIGFSLKSETLAAYEAALFCASIDKSQFLGYFGIPADRLPWPSIGLPPNSVGDRGPGCELKVPEITIRETAPSYLAQAKPNVESNHPRNDKLEEGRKIVFANGSVQDMARREIIRALQHNNSARVEITPDLILAGVMPTPNGVWNYLDARGRNDCSNVAFAIAARRHLPTIDVRCDRKGIHFGDFFYHSKELAGSGLLNKATQGSFRLKAHVLAMTLRTIWVDAGDKLIEVEYKPRIAMGDSSMSLSLAEIPSLKKIIGQSDHGLEGHQRAIQMETSEILRKLTGMSMNPRDKIASRSLLQNENSRSMSAEIRETLEARNGN